MRNIIAPRASQGNAVIDRSGIQRLVQVKSSSTEGRRLMDRMKKEVQHIYRDGVLYKTVTTVYHPVPAPEEARNVRKEAKAD